MIQNIYSIIIGVLLGVIVSAVFIIMFAIYEWIQRTMGKDFNG